MKKVVKAGRIINWDKETENGYIIIEGEKIAEVTDRYELTGSEEVIDASSFDVYPGAIDPHTHLNDPGETHSEDFYSGTAGAAAGGITTVLDMPVTIPLVDNPEALLQKIEIAESKALVDVGLWCAVTPDNMSMLEKLASMGAVGFKAYLSYSRFCKSLNFGQMLDAMKELKRIDALMAIHAEIQDIVDACEKPYRESGSCKFSDFARGRAALAEKIAVVNAVELAKETGVKMHIVHATVPEAIETVWKAKEQGYPVSVETCPHYLTRTLEDLDRNDIGSFGVCIPPLRRPEDVEGLWKAVEKNKIDFIGSDHATYTFEEKNTTDIWKTYFGTTAIQTMVPLVYDGMMKRGMSKRDFAALVSCNAARRYRLKDKGYIGKGFDADLFFMDPKGSWTVDNSDLLYKMKWSIYEGMKLEGRIISTMVRGNLVYSEGNILQEAGYGRFIKPR